MPDAPVLLAGRYRLGASLGRGGMGQVLLARDETLERDVAIKEIDQPFGADGGASARRTIREARAAARINHPNVVQVYDVLQLDDRTWIVMEYVPSRSLREEIAEQGPLDPYRVARIGVELLGALRTAHRLGVEHRDVKPANVLLADDGRVLLTDFGIAAVDDDGVISRSDILVGSPHFMAPERVKGAPSGPEADLWSLGATLYAAIEGRSPYQRGSTMATLTAIATEEPDPPVHAGVLRPLLDGLLRKDPATRMTAEDAESLARAVIDGLSTSAESSTGQQTKPSGLAGFAASLPGVFRIPRPRFSGDKSTGGSRGGDSRGDGSRSGASRGSGSRAGRAAPAPGSRAAAPASKPASAPGVGAAAESAAELEAAARGDAASRPRGESESAAAGSDMKPEAVRGAAASSGVELEPGADEVAAAGADSGPEAVQGAAAGSGVKAEPGADTAGPKSGLDAEAAPGSAADLEPGAVADAAAGPGSGLDAEAAPGSRVDLEPGAVADAAAGPGVDLESKAGPGTVAAPVVETGLGADAAARPGSGPGSGLDAEAAPGSAADLEPGADADAAARPGADLKPGADAAAGPDADLKPGADAAAGPDADLKPGADAAAGPGADLESKAGPVTVAPPAVGTDPGAADRPGGGLEPEAAGRAASSPEVAMGPGAVPDAAVEPETVSAPITGTSPEAGREFEPDAKGRQSEADTKVDTVPPTVGLAVGSGRRGLDVPDDDVAGTGRRRRGLIVAAAALAVALVAGVAWAVTGRTGGPEAQPTQSVAAPVGGATAGGTAGATSATPSPAASSSAAPVPVPPSPTPTGDGRPQLPAGWVKYTDKTGFSLYVPAGWERSKEGSIVYFRGDGKILGIDQTDEPKSNPVKDWTNQAENRVRGGDFPQYDEVHIKAVDYFRKAADWEFTFMRDGVRRHVNNRGTVVADDKAYGIYWQTPDSEWNESRDDLQLVFDSFVPAKS
ncbi:serine/threonine-protein kinase [Actinoplanes xinjiangensis]|uniref:serine/threonine-protein kinase n=1 Tax=Actinoplanes xinjiangensis TaxID=512350 RepID=UPI003415C7E8